MFDSGANEFKRNHKEFSVPIQTSFNISAAKLPPVAFIDINDPDLVSEPIDFFSHVLSTTGENMLVFLPCALTTGSRKIAAFGRVPSEKGQEIVDPTRTYTPALLKLFLKMTASLPPKTQKIH